MSNIKDIIKSKKILILDGAFSTELEKKGFNLNDSLWSAKVLIESPDAIKEVHKDYLIAGADCIITASYQATYEGFMKKGLTENEAEHLIKLSTILAKETRDEFWDNLEEKSDKIKPLVAASVGPYGAFLADGSEYRGDYKIGFEELKKFHKKRLETLIDGNPDLLACETIPCLEEAKALAELLKENGKSCGWISFSAKDGEHINSGEKISECAKILDKYNEIVAIGINCTPPQYVESLIEEIRKGTNKPIIVYPNSGETYDAKDKIWHGNCCSNSYAESALNWFKSGATIIGGCCRTTPKDISEIKKLLSNLS